MILKVHLCCCEDQLPVIKLSIRPHIWHADEGALQQSSDWAATVMTSVPLSKPQWREAWYYALASIQWWGQHW